MKTKFYFFKSFAIFLIVIILASCENDKNDKAKRIFSKKLIIADYPFNGNADDISDGLNNGQVYGPILTIGRNNKTNGAYLFDGNDDYIQLPKEVALNSDSSFSIETWIYKDCYTSDGKYIDDGVFGQSDGELGSDYPLIALEIYSNKTIRGVIRGVNNPVLEEHPNDTLKDNTWHHIVLVRNSKENSLSLYLNGNLISKSDTTLNGNTLSNDFVSVGAVFDDLQTLYHFFCGKIDMIRLWNISLTPADINELKNDKYLIE